MTLYLSIQKGRLVVQPLSPPDSKPLGRFGPGEGDGLARLLLRLARAGRWTGATMNGSSMDFAREDGWPYPTAHPFVKRAVDKMAKLAVKGLA